MRHRPAPAPRPGSRGVRLALGALVSTVLTGLVLSVPVVSGASGRTPYVALDSSSATSATSATRTAGRTTHHDSPVVMGEDGSPAPSATGTAAQTAVPASMPPATSPSAAPAVTAPATTTTSAPASEPTPAAAAAEASTPTPTPTPARTPTPAPAPAPVAAAEPADAGAERQVLALVNAQRAAAGCDALTADPELAALARAHSADMRDRDFFDHVNPDHLDPFQRGDEAGIAVHAENIAHGQTDPAAVMKAWMNSAGHRAKILDCDLTRVGVGIAEGAGGPWWTQDFA